jgi:hypothetical protein
MTDLPLPTSRERPDDDFRFGELSPLAAALCDGTIDGEAFARLEELLLASPAARRWYIAYLDLHGDLSWNHLSGYQRTMGGPSCKSTCGEEQVESRRGEREEGRGERGVEAVNTGNASPLSPLPFRDLWFDIGAAFSYAVAVLVMALAVATAWTWRLPATEETAHRTLQEPVTPIAKRTDSAPAMPVARITKLTNCQWAEAGMALQPQTDVRAGQRYVLKSGKLEITYQTGTRVVVQGPATFEVDSSYSGYLSRGVLTAYVPGEERNTTGSRDRATGREDAASSEAEVASHPLFHVRTPHGITSNRKGEFRVWVDESGQDFAYCVRGVVVMRAIEKGGGIVVLRHGKPKETPVYGAQEHQGLKEVPEEGPRRHSLPGT